MKRFFNTAGPCKPEMHYMLPAAERLPDAPRVIDQFGYFVVHAPRQTGKTTTLRALAEKLTAEGRYAALHFSCEAGEVAGDDYVQAQRALLDDLRLRAEVALPADLRPPRWPGDGHELRYELKKTWRDGARFVRFDPYELIARICAMVPPPRFHMVRFHGVLAPNAKLREQVVASAKPYVPPQENTVPNPVQLPLFGKLFDEPKADVMYARRKPWAWLLRHVFAIDVTHPSKVRRSNEVASSSIDGRRDTRGFGTGGFVGARSTETQESAIGATLAAVSEETSHVKGAASCVSLRSSSPAPLRTCVRASKKFDADKH